MYRISIDRGAQRSLARIPEPEYGRITAAIRALAANPRPPGCTKLTGRDAWRIRIGNYRVIYEIEDGSRSVLVVEVGHRRDVYR